MADVYIEQQRAFGGIIDTVEATQDSRSTRHLDDVESILRVPGLELDLSYIDREAARLGVFGTWRELLDRSGPGRNPL